MKINTNPVRGTRDFTPNEMEIRDYVQKVILDTYKSHGFSKIKTPILEDINLLLGSDGGENLKLLFKIIKRGKKLNLDKEELKEIDLVDIGLRYDLTLPLARYCSNNKGKLSMPFKCIQIDEVFRAERPQKGRFREFYQCDIDMIGESSINAEIELINTTTKALINLGFKDFKVRINDRRILRDLILSAGFSEEDVSSVSITFDKMDKVGAEGVSKELLNKGYDENVVEKFINTIDSNNLSSIDQLIKLGKELGTDEGVISDIKKVIDTISMLSENKYEIVYDKSLVRGMGYYTGMIFEIVSDEFSTSIAGGGRYDGMIGKFINEQVPAVGFSIGFERIISILMDNDFNVPKEKTKVVVLYDKNNDDILDVIKYANNLREQDYIVSTIPAHKKLRRQLDNIKSEGFDKYIIYGRDEELVSFD